MIKLEEFLKLAEIDPQIGSFNLITKILKINNIDFYISNYDHYQQEEFNVTVFDREVELPFYDGYRMSIKMPDLDSLVEMVKKTYKLHLFFND